jgi:hypothetical protein
MKIILTIILIGLSLLGQAEDQVLGQSDLIIENKFASDYANVILQISYEIEQERPGVQLQQIDRQTFEKIFKEKISRFTEVYDQAVDIPSAQKQVFKNLIKYINLKALYNIFVKIVIKGKVFFRKKSFGIAIAILIGVTCEYLVPILLIQSGLGMVAPIAPFVPWSMTFMRIPDMLEKLKMKRRLIDALGTKAAYLDYIDHINIMKSHLKLETPEHFLFPIKMTNQGTEVIVGTRTSTMRNLLGKLGFFQDSISFESLIRFNLLHNPSDSYVRYVSLMDASRDIKTSLIAQHVIKNGNDELKLLFRQKFSSHIFTVEGAETWSGMFNWTKQAMKITDYNQLIKMIKEMPAEIDVREVFGVYENILLPKYAENFDIGYVEYRKLLQTFQAMKARVLRSGDLNFHVENRAEFIKYLDLSLKANRLSPCTNSHNQVLHFLMKSI